MDVPSGVSPSILRAYAGVLRRRLAMIVVVVIACCAAALGLTLRQSPVYEASSQVLLQGSPSEQVLQSGNQAVLGLYNGGQTEVQVMRSQSVVAAVAKELGHQPRVVITSIGTTNVVNVAARAGSPTAAATDANTYARVYAENRKKQLVDDLLAASTELQTRIAQLDTDLATLQQPLVAVENQIAATTRPDALASLQAQRNNIEGQISARQSSITTRRTSYANQLDQLQLAVNLTVTGGAQVISSASEPSVPISPHPARTGAIALVIGVVLGVGLAFLFDQLDDRIRTKEHLEALSGLPTLGLVPDVPKWRRPDDPSVILEPSTSSPVAEAYRSLRTAIQFIGIESPAHVIQVTSATVADGKTTAVVELGMALAEAGKRVIIVDGDLRRPRIASIFRREDETGLTNVLLRDGSLADAVAQVPGHPQLAVLPAGPVPPNPSEMLVLRRFADLIAALRAESDYVLIDTPPVLPVADALIVSAVSEATLLVVKAERSTEKDVRRAIELLRQVDAPLVGTVFNDIRRQSGYGASYGYAYRYSYGYGYGPRTEGDRRRRWLRRRRPDAAAAPAPARPDAQGRAKRRGEKDEELTRS